MNIFIIIKITKSARFRKKFQTRGQNEEEVEAENQELDIIEEEEEVEINEDPEVKKLLKMVKIRPVLFFFNNDTFPITNKGY